MAIRKTKTSPSSLEIWDDAFDKDRMYMVVSKVPDAVPSAWLVTAVYEMVSQQVEFYSSAEEAVEGAIKHIEEVGDELDAASRSIE